MGYPLVLSGSASWNGRQWNSRHHRSTGRCQDGAVGPFHGSGACDHPSSSPSRSRFLIFQMLRFSWCQVWILFNLVTEIPVFISCRQEAVKACDGSTSVRILDPSDIAKAVIYAATQASHVGVNEILVEPREAPIWYFQSINRLYKSTKTSWHIWRRQCTKKSIITLWSSLVSTFSSLCLFYTY